MAKELPVDEAVDHSVKVSMNEEVRMNMWIVFLFGIFNTLVIINSIILF